METGKRHIPENNATLVAIFNRMAACYRFLGKEERFRATAYGNAAGTIVNLDKDISFFAKNINSLDKLKGIGESIAEKIMEYLETGRIKTYEDLAKQVPFDLLDLLDISGFGPATIKILHEKLKINNRDDLVLALEKGKLDKLKGFGPKKIENMKRGLKLYKETYTRMTFTDAAKIANEILGEIIKIPAVLKAEIAGSIRRKNDTIGDIDIVIAADGKNWKKIIKRFTGLPQVNRILASGSTRASVLLKNNNTQVDIRVVHDYEFGAAMLYFTGSREHTIRLRTMAKEKGFKINEYGLFDSNTGKKLAGDTEESIYKVLGLKYIPPEQRIGKHEIEKAMTKKLEPV